MTLNKQTRSIKKKLKGFEKTHKYAEGLLGNYSGTVTVPNSEQRVYVRVNGVLLTAYDDFTAHVENLPVLVGYDSDHPRLLRVIGIKRRGAVALPPAIGVTNHHHRHEWRGGDDVVFIDHRQILGLRVTPVSGELKVKVDKGVVEGSGGYGYAESVLGIDLSGSEPGSGARYVLIYVKADRTFGIVDGSTKSAELLTIADVPQRPSGTIALAAVRIEAGQTEISENYYNPDIIDLRFASISAAATEISNSVGALEMEFDLKFTKHAVLGG